LVVGWETQREYVAGNMFPSDASMFAGIEPLPSSSSSLVFEWQKRRDSNPRLLRDRQAF
jgi:hypothetical protein